VRSEDPFARLLAAITAGREDEPDPLNTGRRQYPGSRCYSRALDVEPADLMDPDELAGLDALAPGELPTGLAIVELRHSRRRRFGSDDYLTEDEAEPFAELLELAA